MKRRLVWKIYVYGLILLALAGVASALVGAAYGRGPWRDFGQRLITYLADNHADYLHDPPALARELSESAEQLGVALAVYRNDGTLIAASEPTPLPPLPAHERKSQDVERLRRRGIFWRPMGDGAYLVGQLPWMPQPFERGFAIFGAVLAVLAVVSIPFARTIARPIEKLTTAAREFGAGHLGARSGVRAKGEFGELAVAFDEMAERIQRLIQSEKELLANVSHELRTPLSRIRIALELGAEGDAAAAQRYLGEISADLSELEQLIADVFTAAKLDMPTGTTPLHLTECASGEIVGRAAERFRSIAPGRELRVRTEGQLPLLEADPVLLRRVIDNLLDNARKYSEGPVELVARGSPERLVVEVRDSGIGIDAADLPSIFTPFFRTDRSRARGSGGVGLGLPLARRIVEAHGGTIDASSTPGQGTTLRFEIPAAVRAPSAALR